MQGNMCKTDSTARPEESRARRRGPAALCFASRKKQGSRRERDRLLDQLIVAAADWQPASRKPIVRSPSPDPHLYRGTRRNTSTRRSVWHRWLGFGPSPLTGLAACRARACRVCSRNEKAARRLARREQGVRRLRDCGARGTTKSTSQIATPPAHARSRSRPCARQTVLCEKRRVSPRGGRDGGAAVAANVALWSTGSLAPCRPSRASELIAEGAIGRSAGSGRWHLPTGSRAICRRAGKRPRGRRRAAFTGVHTVDYLEWLVGPVRAARHHLIAFRRPSDDKCTAEVQLVDGESARSRSRRRSEGAAFVGSSANQALDLENAIADTCGRARSRSTTGMFISLARRQVTVAARMHETRRRLVERSPTVGLRTLV